MEKDYLKSYKLFKIIQLVLLILFGIAFFSNLYFDPLLKNTVFSNKNLLSICVFIWAFMIYSVLTIVWDFHHIERSISQKSILDQITYLDTLTGIPNRYSFDLMIEKLDDKTLKELGCLLLSLPDLEQINQSQGRKYGNSLLIEFSKQFEKLGDQYGFICRNSGNEFILVIEHCSEDKINDFISKLKDALPSGINISYHYVLNKQANVSEFTELLSLVYQEAKRG